MNTTSELITNLNVQLRERAMQKNPWALGTAYMINSPPSPWPASVNRMYGHISYISIHFEALGHQSDLCSYHEGVLYIYISDGKHETNSTSKIRRLRLNVGIDVYSSMTAINSTVLPHQTHPSILNAHSTYSRADQISRKHN